MFTPQPDTWVIQHLLKAADKNGDQNTTKKCFASLKKKKIDGIFLKNYSEE